MAKTEFLMGGKTFRLKPTSPANTKRWNEAYAEFLQNEDEDQLEDLYWKVWRVMVEGPHDDLNREEQFDMKVVEEAMTLFLPHSKLTTLRLLGFLPSSDPGRPDLVSRLLGSP